MTHYNIDFDRILRRKAIAKRMSDRAKKIADEADKEVLDAVGIAIDKEYSNKGDMFGTVNVDAGEFQVKVDTPKTVKWDEDGLESLFNRIMADGGLPHEYITTKRTVEEEKYKHFPLVVKDLFDPFRTTKTGKQKIEIKKKGN